MARASRSAQLLVFDSQRPRAVRPAAAIVAHDHPLIQKLAKLLRMEQSGQLEAANRRNSLQAVDMYLTMTLEEIGEDEEDGDAA